MNDAPATVALAAESCASYSDYLLLNFDFHIVFHPDGVADQVMRAGNHGEMGPRRSLEISLAMISHDGVAPVEITANGEGDNLRVEAFGEGRFIGAIESLFAPHELVMKLGDDGVRSL